MGLKIVFTSCFLHVLCNIIKKCFSCSSISILNLKWLRTDGTSYTKLKEIFLFILLFTFSQLRFKKHFYRTHESRPFFWDRLGSAPRKGSDAVLKLWNVLENVANEQTIRFTIGSLLSPSWKIKSYRHRCIFIRKRLFPEKIMRR